jgi:hypothetical protein
MSNQYSTTHNSWDQNLVLPFVVTAFNEREVYLDPMWAIKIHRVTADNKQIQAEPYEAFFDDLNFSKLSIDDTPFIYTVRLRNLHFARTFDQNGFQLERYVIPESARQIKIEYRLRETDERLGPVITLISNLV